MPTFVARYVARNRNLRRDRRVFLYVQTERSVWVRVDVDAAQARRIATLVSLEATIGLLARLFIAPVAAHSAQNAR